MPIRHKITHICKLHRPNKLEVNILTNSEALSYFRAPEGWDRWACSRVGIYKRIYIYILNKSYRLKQEDKTSEQQLDNDFDVILIHKSEEQSNSWKEKQSSPNQRWKK